MFQGRKTRNQKHSQLETQKYNSRLRFNLAVDFAAPKNTHTGCYGRLASEFGPEVCSESFKSENLFLGENPRYNC